MSTLALSQLLGTTVCDSSGVVSGRVREVALLPAEDPVRVSGLVVRTADGDRLVDARAVKALSTKRVTVSDSAASWRRMSRTEGLLLLERDLLDQQIIDVHGRKVVRVNDIDLQQEHHNGNISLKVLEVEVGARGALRRLLKGIVPSAAIEALTSRMPTKVIPWEFVNLIETDPARPVHLKLEHGRLSKMHPADLADILEELAPAERDAVFASLDEQVAAEALEEIDPKLQKSLVEGMASERAADIVEEMDPDAAADLLESLPEERSEEILEEMEPKEREEVTELLEFKEDTAAGRMTTDYIALPATATVTDAIDHIRNFEGGVESISTIYLIDADEKLIGAIPLAMLTIAKPKEQLRGLSTEPVICCQTNTKDKEVAELFDKYNLLTLPVVNRAGKMEGLITADDVINLLRHKR